MVLGFLRNWNAQFVLLLVLLYTQVFVFLFLVHLSPVLDVPALEWYALHNQVGLAAGEQPTGTLTPLERLRWTARGVTEWIDALFDSSSSTYPSSPPLLPLHDAAPLLHAHGPASQLRFHVHSRSPWIWRYLDHSARRFATREELQRHMMQDTIRQTVWEKTAAAVEEGAEQVTQPVGATNERVGEPAHTPAAAGVDPSALSSATSRWTARHVDPTCRDEIGSGMLTRWEATKQTFCATPGAEMEADGQIPAASALDDSAIRDAVARVEAGEAGLSVQQEQLPPGALVCRSITLPFQPPPTAPHSWCAARNLFIDLSLFTPGANAPRFRAGYVMGKANHYHYTQRSASSSSPATFSSRCLVTPQFRVDAISADHQRDIVDAFGTAGDKQLKLWHTFLTRVASKQTTLMQPARSNSGIVDSATPPPPPPQTLDEFLLPTRGLPAAAAPPLLVLPWTLLLVTRENGEHCNFFHTLTDLYNAWLTMRALGLRREHTQVLLLDNHKPGPFDPAWERVYSGAGPLLKANTLLEKEKGFREGSILASTAVIVPPGYASPLYRRLHEDDPQCSKQSDLLPEFARFFLDGYAISYQAWQTTSNLEQIAGIDADKERQAFRQTIIGVDAGGPTTVAVAPLQSDAPVVVPPPSALAAVSAPSLPVLHVLFVSRRPYDVFVSHSKIARQILNEASLLDFVVEGARTSRGPYAHLRVDVVDLARLEFQQQLKLVAATDLLVGMHGAVRRHAREI
jgi:hypothetical protein